MAMTPEEIALYEGTRDAPLRMRALLADTLAQARDPGPTGGLINYEDVANAAAMLAASLYRLHHRATEGEACRARSLRGNMLAMWDKAIPACAERAHVSYRAYYRPRAAAVADPAADETTEVNRLRDTNAMLAAALRAFEAAMLVGATMPLAEVQEMARTALAAVEN